MKATLNCLPCIVRQGVDAATRATDNPALQRAAMAEALESLSRAQLDDTPMVLGSTVHEAIARVTACPDPWEEVKRESNLEALALYGKLTATVAEADDPLLTAAKIAIAGNIMDFGALATFDVEATVQNALQNDFAIGEFGNFRRQLATAKNLLYIADNAGEIVFDRVFIEQMRGVAVTVALKSRPFINDAMLADAKQVGLDKIARLVTVAPGATSGASFDAAWDQADIIIAKGQGNYEVFSEAEGPIFFLLLAKCAVIAAEIGVKQRDMIFQSQGERRGVR
jgi:damage-control phosphatase, subfamily I